MREVMFKNLLWPDAHRRDLLMAETVTEGDVVIKTQRRCIHFVKDRINIKDSSNLADLKEITESKGLQKRHYYVVKRHDSKTGEDKLSCRIRGFLYIVMGSHMYLVAFINSFKINVKKLSFSH